MKKKNISTKIILLFSFSIITVFYLICHCPFRFFFGVSCPGCGMTRAFFSLVNFNFSSAFYYHPLIFIMPFIAAYTVARLIKKRPPFGKKCETVLLSITLALFIAVYIFRLATGSQVVKPDFSESVLHKIITLIMGAISND